jgi:MFS family permease
MCANVVLGVGLGASTWVASATVIANWFGERRGTVLGTAGMETGGMVMMFIVGYVISRYSWRVEYLVVSIPTVVLILPLISIGRKDTASILVCADGGGYCEGTARL